MTNVPVPGWYPDPEMEGRLRYWDGTRWTEHLAAPQAAVSQPVPPVHSAPLPPLAPAPFRGYGAPVPPHVTLYTNPYEKPPRTKRRALEETLTSGERVRAAAIDAGLLIPFFVLGFGFGPLLGWIAGNSASAHHAYHVVGIVVSVVLGLGLIGWNFLVREVTLGTDLVIRLKNKAP